MLKGIFYQNDKNQGHDKYSAVFSIHIKPDINGLVVPHSVEIHVVVKIGNFISQSHPIVLTFIDTVAHHVREFEDQLLSFFGVLADQAIQVIQSIEKEVRVYLAFQMH